jgi:PadR family transcriptional regulator, regulatory protein PadR
VHDAAQLDQLKSTHMPRKSPSILRGTLDLLILKTLQLEPRHGVGVADRIQQMTRGEFALGPGSLFPALHRLEQRGWISGEWRSTPEGRRAKYYQLTPAGRARLTHEHALWDRIVTAMQYVLQS